MFFLIKEAQWVMLDFIYFSDMFYNIQQCFELHKLRLAKRISYIVSNISQTALGSLNLLYYIRM